MLKVTVTLATFIPKQGYIITHTYNCKSPINSFIGSEAMAFGPKLGCSMNMSLQIKPKQCSSN